jgi:hypothetical protein
VPCFSLSLSSQAAIKRAINFAPYADLLWLETKSPDLAQARYFARKIREKYPRKCVLAWSTFLRKLTTGIKVACLQSKPQLQLVETRIHWSVVEAVLFCGLD